MLELHVYGPGLGLPSIEVKCLATIILLQSCFSPDNSRWVCIASNNPSVSPFNELPALRNGEIWVSGFKNIAEYIRTECDDCDNSFAFTLDAKQFADCEAYISFLESRGLPLLDLSLYVSRDNYTTITRTELSNLLAWPQSWTTPQRLRESARKRSGHLDLSGLDVDAVREKELKKENEGIAAVIPKSLRLPKRSVTGVLGSSAEATRFRLEAVTEDFFEPLDSLLGESAYFLGSKMSVLDCLALAIFLQMDIEDLPQPWLSHALQKHTNLKNWVVSKRAETVDIDPIPWRTPASRSWFQMLSSTIDSLSDSTNIAISAIPIRTKQVKVASPTDRPSSGLAYLQQKIDYFADLQKSSTQLRGLVTATIASAGIMGTLMYMGLLVVSLPQRKKPLRHGFGEAGSFLGLR